MATATTRFHDPSALAEAVYKRLRAMPWSERQRFRMMGVGYTNELLGDEQGKRAVRVQARFINNAMKATLHGAAVSDALEDGRVGSDPVNDEPDRYWDDRCRELARARRLES
ncbi:acetyl-CoA hydrolase/transferase C-terminal domain-containing protein [Halochromatium glycolicum]|uniref:Uncharacterized protein n=1 Tax=Halochromatium glycolicum TaxID=85075 RepID=A0AAJ0U852_9GAMM|nr:acetyl-CoA hydrolase/transferase C-terminal domain-containing protein [Halochromatium glycolicum]MBK1707085.1 hypothetical protein [Halochromatium glycolicum]